MHHRQFKEIPFSMVFCFLCVWDPGHLLRHILRFLQLLGRSETVALKSLRMIERFFLLSEGFNL